MWAHQKVAVSKNKIVYAHEYKQIISAEKLHEPEIDVTLQKKINADLKKFRTRRFRDPSACAVLTGDIGEIFQSRENYITTILAVFYFILWRVFRYLCNSLPFF